MAIFRKWDRGNLLPIDNGTYDVFIYQASGYVHRELRADEKLVVALELRKGGSAEVLGGSITHAVRPDGGPLRIEADAGYCSAIDYSLKLPEASAMKTQIDAALDKIANGATAWMEHGSSMAIVRPGLANGLYPILLIKDAAGNLRSVFIDFELIDGQLDEAK